MSFAFIRPRHFRHVSPIVLPGIFVPARAIRTYCPNTSAVGRAGVVEEQPTAVWPLACADLAALIGYTTYMRLLRDIGASRAGSYAFVSPVIAVALGALFFSPASVSG